MTHLDSNFDSPTPSDAKTATRYSIGFCPVCGSGLCAIRACGLTDNRPSHGLVVCDECEAIWLQPDLKGVHIYADAETPICPIDQSPLYQGSNRWATPEDIERIGWIEAVNSELTYRPTSKGTDSKDS